jgi:hypothetical protein
MPGSSRRNPARDRAIDDWFQGWFLPLFAATRRTKNESILRGDDVDIATRSAAQ